MKPELIHALISGLGDLPDLLPGTYEVNETVTLNIHGTVRRSRDGEYTPTVAVPLKATMALLLHLAGFSRKRAMNLLVEAMTKAIHLGEKGEAEIETLLKDIEAATERVAATLDALPKKTRRGQTRVKAVVTELESLVNAA